MNGWNMTSKSTKKNGLPKSAERRLKPFIDRGIQSGIFTDDSTVIDLWRRHAKNPEHQSVISDLGGIKNEVAQNFVTDTVLVDLSSILRQKRYLAHMDIWEVSHRTVGIAKGNPRPACFIMGQAVVEDGGGSVMEPALFRMSLWDADTALADDLEANGTYAVNVSCRNLDADILDLKTLSGLSNFNAEAFEHGDRATLLREMYEVTPIAELGDDLSRTPNDFRLVEAMVSYSGLQNSRAGNQFGKMLLKDDSTMTMEAIESGENLLLTAITSTDIASRFGKYSKILALCTTKDNGQYGLSATIETAIGLVVVEAPEVETKAKETKEDDAASYFSKSTNDIPVIDDDDDDDDDESDDAGESSAEDSEEAATEESDEAPKVEADSDESTDSDDDDDDWDDWD